MCRIVKENRQATTDCLTKYYMEEFRDQLNWPTEAMRNTFRRNLGLEFKDVKLWRTKRIAKKYIKNVTSNNMGLVELLSYDTTKKARFILQGKGESR